MTVKFNNVLLGKELRNKRKVVSAVGTTWLQKNEAAEKVGIHQSTYMEVEAAKNKTVDIITLFKCCKWLEVPMEMFFVKSKK